MRKLGLISTLAALLRLAGPRAGGYEHMLARQSRSGTLRLRSKPARGRQLNQAGRHQRNRWKNVT